MSRRCLFRSQQLAGSLPGEPRPAARGRCPLASLLPLPSAPPAQARGPAQPDCQLFNLPAPGCEPAAQGSARRAAGCWLLLGGGGSAAGAGCTAGSIRVEVGGAYGHLLTATLQLKLQPTARLMEMGTESAAAAVLPTLPPAPQPTPEPLTCSHSSAGASFKAWRQALLTRGRTARLGSGPSVSEALLPARWRAMRSMANAGRSAMASRELGRPLKRADVLPLHATAAQRGSRSGLHAGAAAWRLMHHNLAWQFTINFTLLLCSPIQSMEMKRPGVTSRQRQRWAPAGCCGLRLKLQMKSVHTYETDGGESSQNWDRVQCSWKGVRQSGSRIHASCAGVAAPHANRTSTNARKLCKSWGPGWAVPNLVTGRQGKSTELGDAGAPCMRLLASPAATKCCSGVHPVCALNVLKGGAGPLARGAGLPGLQHHSGHAVRVVGGALLAHGPAKAGGAGPAVALAEVLSGGLAAVLQVAITQSGGCTGAK